MAADQTTPAQGGSKRACFPFPALPSGDEVYDGIMSRIEPELISSSLQMLKEKYRNETPEQSKSRWVRYTAAFAEYDKRYAAYAAELERNVHLYQQYALKTTEKASRDEDAQNLSNIEQRFSTV